MKRLLACLVAIVLAHVAVLMAAPPTLGQHGAAENVGSSITLSPTGLTDGADLIVGVGQDGSDPDQTFSVSDGTNTYTSRCLSPRTTGASPDRQTQIFTAEGITTTAGALTITVTITNGTSATSAQYVEVLGSGAGYSTTATGTAESAAATSHSATTALSTGSDVFAYSIMAANTGFGTFTPTSSPAFTTLNTDFANTAIVSQYYSNATGLSSNTLDWTSSASRTTAGCAVAFVTSGGPTGPPVGSLGLLGLGR